ncbi:MAG: ATP-binding protein [Dysgonamonadaceae bacterium]|jgi:predicted ATP-binding protein involved in virulence|nr:ATP-binding protein [Dysgonamonadaceae bacterium]
MYLIKRIEIKGLFHQYDLKWDLNPDVNILVGINGTGKSTILRIINACLSKKTAYLQEQGIEIDIESENSNQFNFDYEFVSTFDVPLADKAKIGQSESPLDKELQKVIYTVGKEKQLSFSNYRFKATNYPEIAEKVNARIRAFFDLVNDFLKETGKIIDIDRNSNDIIFHKDDLIISLDRLSSGEKQMLLILFTVFLMDEKSYILLMDEPEISLHIGWQQRLIDVIRQLNPNCQLIIATHSPSIFGKGWGDKLFFVKDLIQGS